MKPLFRLAYAGIGMMLPVGINPQNEIPFNHHFPMAFAMALPMACPKRQLLRPPRSPRPLRADGRTPSLEGRPNGPRPWNGDLLEYRK